MAKRIATVSGTAIAPGVSRNGRLYTRENIAKAYTRAKTRIGEGARPISMRTHHAAGDDSTRIVGQVTEMTLQPDGSVKYRADIADTVHGRDIADLVDPEGGTPFLKGVSIRGAWLGRVRRQSGPDGGLVETADDLEITGLDYTAEPGVDVADVADFKRIGDDAAETEERVLIYESVQEALVETATAEETTEAVPVTEAADPAKPFGDVIYADPGYQADKKKRYPLDTKVHVKSAWSYISQADNAKAYTAAQLKRIKGRIKPALKRFGVQIAAENWLIDTAAVAETVTEHMGVGTPEGTFCLSATNGPLSITMSSYCIDPADMELILHAVADAAAAALKSVDPDMDGDMDVPGAPGEDTDSDTETAESVAETGDEPAPEPPAVPEPAEATEDPAPDPAAVPQKEEEEPAVSEPTTQAVVPTPAATDKPAETNAMEALNAKFDTLTGAITDLVGKLTPAPAVATESAPAAVAPAQETVPAAVEETQEQMIARLVAEGVAAERTRIVQETVEATGGPSRKGLVAPVTEHSAPAATEGWPEGWPTENGDPKPLHKWNDNERSQHMGPAIEQYVLGARAR
jgi:hypothetical protein